jgi:hypothetical protein
MFDTPLNHFKSVFAHKFFVAPSDRNYFFARFAKTYGINEEFWWQALQTIEKLLKAGLVLNGVSVKSGYLYLLWNEINDVEVSALAREQVEWLLENIQIGRNAQREFVRILAADRAD